MAVWGLALLAVIRKDIAGAQQQYDSLQHGAIVVTGLIAPNSIATLSNRLLGLVAETMGNLDQAAKHFDDALVFCRRGYRSELAWTCCDYADTLLQRAEPGDRERASPYWTSPSPSPANWACDL